MGLPLMPPGQQLLKEGVNNVIRTPLMLESFMFLMLLMLLLMLLCWIALYTCACVYLVALVGEGQRRPY